ncbi:MAG: DUF481 domain-containing protein [Candidatus Omnitrophota bacterium]
MMKRALAGGFFLFLLLNPLAVFAEEIIFTNGDRLTASILNDSPERITISSQAIGTVTVDRSFVSSPVYENTAGKEKEEGEKHAEWTRKIALGYGQTGGNTFRKRANGSFAMNRKTPANETTFNLSGLYSSSNNKMDVQQYSGLARHAFSFGPNLKWYNFYKFEFNHDYSANIDYRLIPSLGLGYWFSDREDFKLQFETAGGLEHTHYRNSNGPSTEFVLVPRGYFKKKLSGRFWAEQNLVFYLVAEDLRRFRLRSESALIQQITKSFFWKLSLIDDYNAAPSGDAEENDYRIIYAIEYVF